MIEQRIYIDTSVIGGYFDEEFKQPTRLFFKKSIERGVKFIKSDLLLLELTMAPERVKHILTKLPKSLLEKVELNEIAIELADTYINKGVVNKLSIQDCRHIALATVKRADILVSWNFKHIVNLDKIRGYNFVNLQFGYPVIEIRSPKELINYE